jgi:WD40 repeat protein
MFYEGHKLKISAMALHPTKAIVATGEVNMQPDIHIWDPQTLETLAILNTSHKGGVFSFFYYANLPQPPPMGVDLV